MAVLRREANTYGLPTGEPLRRALVRASRTQRKAVTAWIRSGRPEPARARYGRLSGKANHDPDSWDWPGWSAFGLGPLDLAHRMTPILQTFWVAGARKFAPRVGIDPNEWTVVDAHTEAMIESAALAFSDSTLETTSLSIEAAIRKTRQELHAGVVDRGESLNALTKRINAVFDAADTWRARRIAQSEASRAVHAAQEQTAIASGVVAGWKWLASSDACPLCLTIARRAKFVRLGEAFAVVSDNPHYGTVKYPPLHPHCNCTVLEVLDIDAAGVKWSPTLVRPVPEDVDRRGGDEWAAAVAA